MNKKQTASLLGAGTLAGIVILITYLFGAANGPAGAAEAAGELPNVVQKEGQGAELRAQNEELQALVQTLMEREAQYQEQLNLAAEKLAQPDTTIQFEHEVECEDHEEDESEAYEEDHSEEQECLGAESHFEESPESSSVNHEAYEYEDDD